MIAAVHVRPRLCAPAWLWLGLALSIGAAASRGEAAALKSVDMADRMTCRIVENAASFSGIPASFLTRLVWTESRFQAGATSAAGAEGIAQFMPQTAAERGLANPLDPEQAIPKAAELLADFMLRFGNLGLAAAAYNAGPNRVESWLTGTGHLALETRTYVLTLTGHTVDDWAVDRQRQLRVEEPVDQPSCDTIVASLRAKEGMHTLALGSELPLNGNFLTAIAMARFDEARQRYCTHLDAHWPRRMRAVAFARQTAALDDTLPPLCSAFLRSAHAPGN